ncbi:hypothetical protein HaLaN_27209 [Haematococcus lacustris]|uniref:Uncharacterized protein n=1 Tax=Haematococcus lacustris TaxID=44745 RepID=A0A6A0A7V8_HAELA|nr:hypothetical protein HaLaN_27209 [Haematococcus lacustris]
MSLPYAVPNTTHKALHNLHHTCWVEHCEFCMVALVLCLAQGVGKADAMAWAHTTGLAHAVCSHAALYQQPRCLALDPRHVQADAVPILLQAPPALPSSHAHSHATGPGESQADVSSRHRDAMARSAAALLACKPLVARPQPEPGPHSSTWACASGQSLKCSRNSVSHVLPCTCPWADPCGFTLLKPAGGAPQREGLQPVINEWQHTNEVHDHDCTGRHATYLPYTQKHPGSIMEN